MHGVNLDLLHTAPKRSAYAQHRAEHLASLRAARHQRWSAILSRLLGWAALHRAAQPPAVAPTACR